MYLTPRTKRFTGAGAAVLASFLVLDLVGAGTVPALATAATAARTGGAWSGLWLSGEGGDAASPTTTLKQIRTIIGADTGAAAGLAGKGVGTALIDAGVAPVPGLPASRIVNAPDLSFESQSAD